MTDWSDNELKIGILAKKLADSVREKKGKAYFASLIEAVKQNLEFDHGFVFSIDNCNGTCRNILTDNAAPASDYIDSEIMDVSIAELTLNKEKAYSVINTRDKIEKNKAGKRGFPPLRVSFPLYDSGDNISGLIVFLCEDESDCEHIAAEAIETQIPRAASELECLQIKQRLNLLEGDYKNLVEFTLDVVWEADLSGVLTSVNGSSQSLYGLPARQMIGKRYTEFMTKASAAKFVGFLTDLSSGQSIYNEQAEHLSGKNEIINVSCNVIPRYDEYRNVTGVLGSTRDISSAVRAQEIIKNNSELFSSILARLPVIFFRVDRNGYLIDIRGNGLSRMGVEDMDWVGKPGYGLFIGMDEQIDSALSGSTVFFENRGTYNGTPWTFYTSMFFDSWSGYGAVGFSVDITEQKYVEEQLIEQLNNNRRLAQKLVEVQEDERRSLARELHDELGQSITAVKSLAMALNVSAGDQYTEVRSLANSIIDLSGRLYEVVNNIMQRLRPDIIDGLDFNEAIRNCIVRSQLETIGVNCGLDIQGETNDLNEVVKITIYRIVQECLTNISKHAMASNVYISIYRGPETINSMNTVAYDKLQRDGSQRYPLNREIIKIDICDDGIGMDLDSVLHGRANTNRHGLQGIEERVKAMGGSLDINASPGKGVNIKAVFLLGQRKMELINSVEPAIVNATDAGSVELDTKVYRSIK